LAARDPSLDLPLDGEHIYISSDGCGVFAPRPETGEVRSSVKQDLADCARVVQALDGVSATSAVAVLTVQDPYITIQPVGQLRLPGDGAVLRVTAIGTPPVNCQWQLNGTNVPGANSFTLVLTNLQLGDFGDYRVLIHNAFGSVTSTVANLTYEPLAYWSRFDSGTGEDLFVVTFSPSGLFVAAAPPSLIPGLFCVIM
jgi:hypothetical protein